MQNFQFTGISHNVINIFSKFNFYKKTIAKPNITSKTIKTNFSQYKIFDKIPFNYSGGKGVAETFATVLNSDTDLIRIVTSVGDKHKNRIASYTYNINKDQNVINNGYIETSRQYRRCGIGEALQLSRIMQFRANNIKRLEIFAIPEAIPFHFKSKLKSDLTEKEETLKFLKDIKNNKYALPYYRQNAEKLSKDLLSYHNNELDTKIAKKLNTFIENYIKQHLHNWENAKFNRDLPMVLTEDSLKQFACFYNKLFKKHGIDYRI